jgi:uncharacterized protein YodC (DUF2158 family)
MTNTQLSAGDTVQLKSGGPLMTIERLERLHNSSDLTAWCVWFDKDGVKQSQTYLPIVLIKAD